MASKQEARRLGFHVSIAGGLHRAVGRALERECTAFQLFCDNPRGWATTARTPEEMEAFRKGRAQARLRPLAVHACYLVNPCAPDRGTFARSVRRMAHELATAAEIGAEFYILHPGSPKGRPHEWAVRRAAQAVARAAEQAGPFPCVLLENTASPHGLGRSFGALGALLDAIGARAPGLRVGVAIDSCHAFAAGYDLREQAQVERLVSEADAAFGRECVQLLHANDSRDPCGSGRDRHWHIGQGTIGSAGLGNLLCHPALKALPVILETPWESIEADLRNIRAIRSLLARAP